VHGQTIVKCTSGANLRRAVTRATWDQIRRAAYREYDYRCGICGARGRMTCHERWAYDDDTATQTLLGFMALCELCHHVKHIGLAGILAREGRLDYDEVVQHFMAVNECDESTFEEHRAQAYHVWRQRSTHPWTVDVGPYAAMVTAKAKGESR
jgi:phage terminase large subunit GpA-like protein